MCVGGVELMCLLSKCVGAGRLLVLIVCVTCVGVCVWKSPSMMIRVVGYLRLMFAMVCLYLFVSDVRCWCW